MCLACLYSGMGSVDILFSIYFTVVPAVFPTTGQIVHSIVAIDLKTKLVMTTQTFPLTLFSL